LRRFLLKFLVSLALVTLIMPMVSAAPPTVIWSDGVSTDDIALSKDGNYVAVASYQEVRFYGRSSGTPLWTKQLGTGAFVVLSIAISADGDCVAAGTDQLGVGGKVYFWKNAKTRTSASADPTWNSAVLGGPIYRRCLDISDDGNYVVACGTGVNVFYWANAKARSTSSEPTTWQIEIPYFNVEAIDLSGDGDYVAAGTNVNLGHSNVMYWKNARILNGNPNPDWTSTEPNAAVVDVAVSDDGNYVAAATGLTLSVHYWANAKSLSNNPASTWYYGSGVYFSSIDMSSDGNAVIAGSSGGVHVNVVPQKGSASRVALAGLGSGGVYFWSGAKGLTGKPQNPTWSYTTEAGIFDVAIDDVGSYMAADGNTVAPGKVYFFNSGGTLLWSYPIDIAVMVSISGDGATLAVGTATVGTGYLLSTGYSSGPRPVGGVVAPANKLEILTPYIALAGLIATLSAVVVVKRRSRD
jgi:WD40 repeat protein